MVSEFTEKSFKKGDLICRQDDKANCLYMLKKGEIDVVVGPENFRKLPPAEIQTKGKTVATISKEGALLGEMGSLLKVRSASLFAKEDCSLNLIPLKEDGLKNAILSKPKFGLKIARIFAKRLQEMNENLNSLHKTEKIISENVQKYGYYLYKNFANIEKRSYVSDKIPKLIAPLRKFDAIKRSKSIKRPKPIKTKKVEIKTSQKGMKTQILERSLAKHEGKNIKIFKKGEVVCEEGDSSKDLFILLSGKLEIIRNEIVIGTVQPGEIIGEMAILLDEDTRRTATLIANSFSKLVNIPEEKFDQIIFSQPLVLVHIVTNLSQKLKKTNDFTMRADQRIKDKIREIEDIEVAYAELMARTAMFDNLLPAEASQVRDDFTKMKMWWDDYQDQIEQLSE